MTSGKQSFHRGPLQAFAPLYWRALDNMTNPGGHKALRMEILLLTRLISTTDKVGDLLGKKSWWATASTDGWAAFTHKDGMEGGKTKIKRKWQKARVKGKHKQKQSCSKGKMGQSESLHYADGSAWRQQLFCRPRRLADVTAGGCKGVWTLCSR